MKIFVIYLVGLFSINSLLAQDLEDLIVTSKGDTIVCNIKGTNIPYIYFYTNPEYPNVTKKIFTSECRSILIKDKSKIENPNSLIIETPEKKAHVYIYRTGGGGLGPAIKITSNSKDLVALKSNNYYLHEVNPGKYAYRWKNKEKPVVRITAKAGEVYFVRCGMESGPSVPVATAGGFSSAPSANISLTLPDPSIGEIEVKSIKKRIN